MALVRRTRSNRQQAVRSRKRSRIPSDLVGIAGVHYVAYALSKRGMVALPTTRNTASYDLIVTNRPGTKHANIQVKTAQRHPNFWPMPRFTKIRHGKHDYYVLVRRLVEDRPPECFMLRGKEARAHVKRVQGGNVGAGAAISRASTLLANTPRREQRRRGRRLGTSGRCEWQAEAPAPNRELERHF